MTRSRSDLADVLAVAVHDLRGPLGVLSGYARMLNGPLGASRPVPTDQMLGSIEESATQISRLVERLNTLAAVASGAVTLTPIATSVADLLEPLAHALPAVPVKVWGDDPAASVWVDPMPAA